jgi:hypothetical protein
MPADRSHTEYVRRKRAVAQAVRRAACAACPEDGPICVTDKATQLSRVFGQQAYVYQAPTGLATTTCCGGSGSDILFNFTACNQSFPFSIIGGVRYTITYKNSMSRIIVYVSSQTDFGLINADNILQPLEQKKASGIVPVSGDVTITGYCTFDLAPGPGTISAPNLVGYNNSGVPLTVTYNSTPYIVAPDDAIGPFQVGDSFIVAL